MNITFANKKSKGYSMTWIDSLVEKKSSSKFQVEKFSMWRVVGYEQATYQIVPGYQ